MLLEGKGRVRSIVCPYHAWSYATDGRLKRAPLMEGAEGFDASSCRLPEIRSEAWNGFLYANLDDDAAPLADGLVGLDGLARNFAMETMTTVHIEEARWAINCSTESSTRPIFSTLPCAATALTWGSPATLESFPPPKSRQ